MEDSTFLHHGPCSECGSSDANSFYTDGHSYCFACGAHDRGEAGAARKAKPRMLQMVNGEVLGLQARKITQLTAKHFNYQVGEYKGKRVQIAPYYDADGQLVAQKLRFKDKSFMVTGTMDDALPFGAHCWPKTGKKLVVTEGEIDCLSMSQVQDNSWPVVSIGCGAGPQIKKYFAKHAAYFRGFEEVVLMFDTDEPGRTAAKAAAEVLGACARIAELPQPYKDANDMLVAGKTKEMLDAMWRAKEYRPEGIVNMADLKEAVKERPQWGLSWPFETLTNLTYGIRTGELYALGAGTGIGKTDFFAQTIEHMARVHKQPVGVFSLEQHPRETATRIAGKLAHKTFHVPDSGWTDADFDLAWAELMQGGRVFLYDSFGNNDWDIVREKIEYLRHAEGVRYFFLDHLTALAAWQEDERKALETIMSDMGALVKRLDVALFFVSHLATPEGTPHEEGGRVTIRHFKGSRAIGYWSHFMFALERNQQDDTAEARKLTRFRVLKDRFTGKATGESFFITYDHTTGMLYEADAPPVQQEEDGAAHGFSPTAPRDEEAF